MKTIEVTDEMYNFLMTLSIELNNQDHRATAMPYIFQIQTKEQVPAPDGNGTQAWIYDNTVIETEQEIKEAIAEHADIEIEDVTDDEFDRRQALLDAGYREIWYEMKDKYENAFLTSKACDEHIARNKHHYNQPVNYLTHAFRNPELETLLKFLCGLTGKEIHK